MPHVAAVTLPPLRVDAVLHADDGVAEHRRDLDGAGAAEVIGLAGHRLLEAGHRRGARAEDRRAADRADHRPCRAAGEQPEAAPSEPAIGGGAGRGGGADAAAAAAIACIVGGDRRAPGAASTR